LGPKILGPEYAHSLHELHEHGSGWVVALAVGAFLVGTAGAFTLYKEQTKDPIFIPLFKNKFYFDELYTALIAGTQELLAVISRYIDQWFIDGLLVRGLSGAAWATGFALRFLQFGNLQGYAFLFGLGVVATIYLLVFR
jgi:NADH-quinone oxidoreductase subunit L